MVYHLAVPRHFQNLAIVHLEMVNVLVAVRIFAKFWHRRSVLVKCDNNAVVQVLNSGKTRDPFLASCARNIWYVAAKHDIKLSYRHVPGKNNGVADLLSRWQGTPVQINKLYAHIHKPIWVNTSQHLLEFDYTI